MTNPGIDPGFQDQSPTQQLVAELRTREAYLNPDPAVYRAAAEVLHGYFVGKASETSEVRDHNFEGAIDHVMSAVGGFYARDELTGRATATGKIGEHAGDAPLEGALRSALQAQHVVEGKTGRRLTNGSVETANVLNELEYFKNVDVSEEVGPNAGWRTLRHRACDALRNATRSVDDQPEVYPLLAQSGAYVAEGIAALADIAALHEKDTGNVGRWDAEKNQLVTYKGNIPQFKDYLQNHVSGALEATQL